jgi:hypothetical protein
MRAALFDPGGAWRTFLGLPELGRRSRLPARAEPVFPAVPERARRVGFCETGVLGWEDRERWKNTGVTRKCARGLRCLDAFNQ